MTLTYPMINRARLIVWLITGAEKAEMLERLWIGDGSLPAGGVSREQALVLTDIAAGV
jgi:6-phosphogluconolactonase